MKLLAAIAVVCLSASAMAQVQLGKGVQIGGSSSSGGVSSFNSRTGAIVPANGDYTLGNIGAGASASGLFDFSPATHLKLPSRAGYTAAVSGEIGYNSTDGNIHFNISSTDLILLGVPSASLPTNGHCAQFTLIGAWWELTDAGAACGSGSGGLTGQVAGYAVEAATPTTATGPFPMDDSITNANTITAHKAFTVNDGTGNPGCISLSASQICLSAPPYNASNAGATTTTTSGTFAVGTSGTIASCSTFRTGNGVLITGAGASGANYVGTIVTCTGTTLTVTPATSTSVATSTVVKHDESAAINTALAALTTTGGTIYGCGVYLVNGPLLDPTGANSLLKVPTILSVAGSTNITITLEGCMPTTPNGSALSGMTLQTSVDTAGGAFIGGKDNASTTFGPFTAVKLVMEHVNVLSTVAAPNLNLIDATWINALAANDMLIAGTCSSIPASSTGGIGLQTPNLANNFQITIDKTFVGCMPKAVLAREHTQIGTLWMANSHDCLTLDGGAGVGANSIAASYVWAQGCSNYAVAGINSTGINIQMYDMETDPGTGTDILDASNQLTGILNYRKQAPQGAATLSGGGNLSACDMRTNICTGGAVTFAGALGGTAGAAKAVFYFGGSISSASYNAYAPFLGSGSVYYANIGIDISHSLFTTWHNTAGTQFGSFDTTGATFPVALGGSQVWSTNPVFIGHANLDGSIVPTAAGLLNVGTTNQFFVTAAGGATATNVTDSALTSGNCVQASTGGLLTTTAGPCGAGGSGALTQITKTVLGAPAASITFSSIPGTYTSLKVVFTGQGSGAVTDTNVQFNGDTTTDYNWVQSLAVPAFASANGNGVTSIHAAILTASSTAPAATSADCTIAGYAATVFGKNISCNFVVNNSGLATGTNVGSWTGTAAITSITLFPTAGNFVTGTTATLYGVQ